MLALWRWHRLGVSSPDQRFLDTETNPTSQCDSRRTHVGHNLLGPLTRKAEIWWGITFDASSSRVITITRGFTNGPYQYSRNINNPAPEQSSQPPGYSHPTRARQVWQPSSRRQSPGWASFQSAPWPVHHRLAPRAIISSPMLTT
ncbi:hypothetical protein PCANC_11468 [Puccinia coronata f. sp. avenae]|uniref:Uncharacterized protein n=1 Tax=Puccinia coronata f. sp. avenae TaxID=200324 RepID=A0A2N5VCM1_9BASI|nr:hypothetical protein PCANC_11468 [Puccinia coronata f. sp. avenae]